MNELLVFFTWKSWLHKNHVFFGNPNISTFKVILNIWRKIRNGTRKSQKQNSQNIWTPMIDNMILVWYFDGATEDDGSKCGVKAILHIEKDQYFKAMWNCGRGTNNRGELLALWMLLWVAQSYKITNLQVSGDSRIILIGILTSIVCRILLWKLGKIK